MSSDSMSLEQIWNDAAKRFASRTSRNLKLKPPKTLDDVRIEIEKQNAEIPDNLPDTKQKVKEAGMNFVLLEAVGWSCCSRCFRGKFRIVGLLVVLADR